MKEFIRDTDYTITKEGVVESPFGVIITPWKESNTGYLLFRIRRNCKPVCYRLHRIIAECFIPNPDNLPFVRHLDDDKSNNELSNLQWGTNSQNVQEGYDNGCYAFKARSHKVRAIKEGYNELFPSLRQAEVATGVSRKTISAILKNKRSNITEYQFSYEMPND